MNKISVIETKHFYPHQPHHKSKAAPCFSIEKKVHSWVKYIRNMQEKKDPP